MKKPVLTKEGVNNFLDMQDAILDKVEELLPIYYESLGKTINDPLDNYEIRTITSEGIMFECSWNDEYNSVPSLWLPTRLLWDTEMLEQVKEKATRREEEKKRNQKEKERQKQEVQEAKERETLAALLSKYGVPEEK